jgi:hypothetical protein
MSQMTSLVMAAIAAWKESVLVTMATVTAMNAHAPTGRGSRMRPSTVDTKMARRLHAWGSVVSRVFFPADSDQIPLFYPKIGHPYLNL